MTDTSAPVLTIVLHPVRDADGVRSWHRCMALLDGRLIVTSDQPVPDAARELLSRNYDPSQLLTARLAGSQHDAAKPKPIGAWAGWTCTETTRDGQQWQEWNPPA